MNNPSFSIRHRRLLSSFTGFLACMCLQWAAVPASFAATGTQARDSGNKNKLLNMIVAKGAGVYYSQNSRSGTAVKFDKTLLGKAYNVGKGAYTGPDSGVAGQLVEALDINSNIVGYFRGEDVIYSSTLTALRAPKADGSGPSNIYRKALIVNYYDKLDKTTLEQNLKSGGGAVKTTHGYIVHVPAVVAPGASLSDERSRVKWIELWEHRFVWKVAKGDDGSTWYLIGDKDEVPDPEKDPSGLIGWVPADKVRLWDTSQALEPNWLTRERRVMEMQASAPAKVYSEKSTAGQAAMSTDVSSLSEQAMVSEDTRIVASQWPPARSRYPLVNSEGLGRANQYYQVAWIGGLYDSTTGEEIIPDPAAVDEGQETVRNIIKGLFTLDVLVVLDGTHSMSHLRQPAIDAVNKIVEKVRSRAPEGWKVRPEDVITRCAVAVYRNRADTEGPYKPFEFLPFQRLDNDAQGPARIMQFLKGIQFNSRAEIREEGVFDGLLKAVEQAKLLQQNNPDSYKVMIVIGDSGDQGHGTTVDQVAAALNEQYYDFYAISVPPEQEVVSRPDYQAFRKELAGLVSKLKLPKDIVGKDETFVPATHILTVSNVTSNTFVDSILDACDKGLRLRNTEVKILANPKEYPMQLQGFVQNILKGRVNLEIFKENRQQVLGVGWTTARNAKDWQQWKVMEYVEIKTLDAYRRFVDPFVILDTTADSVAPDDIRSIITSLEKSFLIAAGQYDPSKKISDIMGDAAKDLPVHSILLSKTIPDLQIYLQSTDPMIKLERKLELERLKLSSRVLQLYMINRKFKFTTDARGRTTGVEEDQRSQVNYWSQRENGTFGWIPQEVFP